MIKHLVFGGKKGALILDKAIMNLDFRTSYPDFCIAITRSRILHDSSISFRRNPKLKHKSCRFRWEFSATYSKSKLLNIPSTWCKRGSVPICPTVGNPTLLKLLQTTWDCRGGSYLGATMVGVYHGRGIWTVVGTLWWTNIAMENHNF